MKNIVVLIASMVLLLTGCKNHPAPQQKADNTLKSIEAPGESVFKLNTAWKSEEGKSLQLKDLKGKVLVMVMIYTSCKAACPRLVADMKNLHNSVPSEYKEKVQYVLVSIDPDHDTPEVLKAFARSREMDGEEWTFLQGSTESVREFANVLSVKYKEISPMDFSHSNIISVFTKEGVLIHQMEGLGVNNKETIESIIKAAKE